MRWKTVWTSAVCVVSFRVEVVAQSLIAEFSGGRYYAGAGDHFGGACSGVPDVDGDGMPDLVIGAAYTDVSSVEVGRAYIFSGATFNAIYSVDGTEDGGRFGYRVNGVSDLDGDGLGDFLVAAPLFDGSGATDTGRVYVYSGGSGGIIRSHDGELAADYFGMSLATIGDLDGDGTNDYLIGAEAHTSISHVNAGRVYAYSGATGTLLFHVTGRATDQFFGESLTRIGDVDGDAIDDFAVGSADGASGGGSGRGRVDAFSGATHVKIATLLGQAPDDGSLGRSLAGGIDADGDGISDLVVGDPNNYRNGSSSGAVFIYSGLSWTVLDAWYGESVDDQFGVKVQTIQDANGDGTADVFVGSTIGDKRNGIAYLFSGQTGHEMYRFVSGLTGDLYGQQVAGVGDLTGDGLVDLMVGAERDGQGGYYDSGRVYLYAGNGLFLQVSANSLNPGDTLDLNWHCRDFSVLTALAVVEINSVPTFSIIDFGYADSLGERSLSATVPPGLSGLDLDVRAFAADSLHGVVTSSIQHLTFL